MPLSLYGQYISERTQDAVLESEYGFLTYRYLDDGKTVYIIDIYVVPEERHKNRAAEMADIVAQSAKIKGCTEMIGTVIPSTKNSTASLKVLLGYGMTLKSSGNDVIVFRKDL